MKYISCLTLNWTDNKQAVGLGYSTSLQPIGVFLDTDTCHGREDEEENSNMKIDNIRDSDAKMAEMAARISVTEAE